MDDVTDVTFPSNDCSGKEVTTNIFFADSNAAQHFSIVFGENGSGKTTISRAIAELAKPDCPLSYCFSYLGKPVALDGASRLTIHVFNEDYVKAKTAVQVDSLNAIMMIGHQIDLHDKIQRIEAENKAMEESLDRLKEEESSEEEQMNLLYKGCEETLRKRWATAKARIKHNTKKANVNNDLVDSLRKKTNVPNVEKDKFDKEVARYTDLSKTEITVNELPADIGSFSIDLKHINSVLQKKINAPRSTDPGLSKKIGAVIKSPDGQKLLESSKKYFSHSGRQYCPYCLRDISDSEINAVVQAVSLLDDRSKEEFLAEIKKCTVEKISEINLQEYRYLNQPELVSGLKDSILKVNNFIEGHINKAVSSKESELYASASPISESEWEAVYENFKTTVSKVGEAIRVFKGERSKLEETKEKLLELNDCLAFADCKETFGRMKTAEEKLRKNGEDQKSSESKIGNNKTKIANLESEMANTKIACDWINNQLADIFGDPSRLTLAPLEKGQGYAVSSHGLPVKAGDLSTGERNIISLVYFFSELCQNKSENEAFKDELSLFIDDPISSFDYGNALGMTQFLAKMIGCVLQNEKSRVVIFTHSFETMCYLDEAVKTRHSLYQLSNFVTTKREEGKTTSLYKWLLQRTYRFAQGEEDGSYETIGNTIRRLLESYFTFNYGKGTEDALDLSTDILNEKLSKEQAEYFSQSKLMIILNADSHGEVGAFSFSQNPSMYSWSKDELRKTAKTAICLLYCLDPLHVRYLVYNKSKGAKTEKDLSLTKDKQTIEGWEKDLNIPQANVKSEQ